MAEKIKLDPDDATPASVYLALARQNATAYPKADCMPCGATIRIDFSSMPSVAIATSMMHQVRSIRTSRDFGKHIVK